MKTVLFDFDGPIANSILSDLRYQCDIKGGDPYDHLGSTIAHHLCKPVRQLDECAVQAKISSTQSWNQGMLKHGACIRQDAVDCLWQLHSIGYAMGVVSNGTKKYIDTLFEQSSCDKQINNVFQYGVWGVDTFHHHKADKILAIAKQFDVSVSQIIYVTDTVNDYHALVGEGVLSLDQLRVVTYGGIHDHALWKKHVPQLQEHQFISDPSDLTSAIVKGY